MRTDDRLGQLPEVVMPSVPIHDIMKRVHCKGIGEVVDAGQAAVRHGLRTAPDQMAAGTDVLFFLRLICNIRYAITIRYT